MQFWGPYLISISGQWLSALGIILITWMIATGIRGILQSRKIDPSLSNVVYIIGLRLSADVAPLSGRVEHWVDHILYVIAVLILVRLTQRVALLGIEWTIKRSNNIIELQHGFIPLVRNMITLFIFFSAIIMLLKHFNYDVMSLVTALGVGSLAVGLAAKDTLSNMISGFILIIDHNLQPGDRVNLGGSIGDVTAIGLRSTQIKTNDGNTLIVPNSDLVNTKILNLSFPTRELLSTVFIRVPLDIPFVKVKEICIELISQLEQSSKARTPAIFLNSLSDGHQLIQILFWVNDFSIAGLAVSSLNEGLNERFRREQIPLLPPPGGNR